MSSFFSIYLFVEKYLKKILVYKFHSIFNEEKCKEKLLLRMRNVYGR